MTTPVVSNNIPRPTTLSANKTTETASPSHVKSRDKSTDTETNLKSRINADISELTADEKIIIEKLKTRDREVGAHEMAHITAGGQYITSGARYNYQAGPDGQRYKIGGEVSLDVSEIPGSPEKTAAKMQTIQNAALAPSNPSATDKAVASKASRKEMQARIETYRELTELKETSQLEKPDPNSDAPHPTGSTIDISV